MKSKATNIEKLYRRYVMPTYTRTGLGIAHAKGSVVTGTDGKQYLDFFPGWGVLALGHCPAAVTRVVGRQSRRLVHLPNTYYHEPQAQLAKSLVQAAFDGKVFFCNSGAEAVEGGIKLARRFGYPKRGEIITMERSFHGRTLGALAATGQSVYRKSFGPLPGGFKTVAFNDLAAVRRAVTAKTVAILLEPIQGEGGVRVASPSFIRGLKKLCRKRKILLILDEVQTGMGRTGTTFAYQQMGVTPDILLLAKGLGGGLPIGAVLARRGIADTLSPGTHASTFGGNPLVCAGALQVLETVGKPAFLRQVRKKGELLKTKLLKLQKKFPVIDEIRGKGLMIGLQLNQSGAPIVEACRQHRLLINCTQGKVLRLMPALNVSSQQMNQAVERLDAAFSEVLS